MVRHPELKVYESKAVAAPPVKKQKAEKHAPNYNPTSIVRFVIHAIVYIILFWNISPSRCLISGVELMLQYDCKLTWQKMMRDGSDAGCFGVGDAKGTVLGPLTFDPQNVQWANANLLVMTVSGRVVSYPVTFRFTCIPSSLRRSTPGHLSSGPLPIL